MGVRVDCLLEGREFPAIPLGRCDMDCRDESDARDKGRPMPPGSREGVGGGSPNESRLLGLAGGS